MLNYSVAELRMQTFSDKLSGFYAIASYIIPYPAYICGTITN